MKPWGRGTIGVLIVGESPGKVEDMRGRPFVGPSGEYLQDAIRELGREFEDLRITNSIICRPPGNKMPQKGREVGYCRPNLAKTIEEFKPRVIITLGRHALETVLQPYWKDSFDALERWTGHAIPLTKHWVCPTWHPSFLLRENNRVMNRLFMQHLEAALDIDEDPPTLPDFKSRIERLYEERDIISALRQFDEQGGPIAFDYETNCLKPEYPKAAIWSASVSDGKRTIAYPWTGRAVAATSLLLRSPRTRKIASNMKFEQRWTLKHLGHPVTNWDWDTVVAAHVQDNRSSIASLKFQSFVQMGIPTYNEHISPYLDSSETHYNRIHEIEMDELLLYNGMDSLFEWHLARRQQIRACRPIPNPPFTRAFDRSPSGCYE